MWTKTVLLPVITTGDMGRPKGNGIVEFIDDNADRGRGFFCMDLVMHMWKDEAVKGWNEWHDRFVRAEVGECPYRDRCKRYSRTMESRARRPVQLNLF